LEHLNKKQKINHTALDPVEMLMLSYAKTTKTFSPIRQAIAKKKISEIISDLEIEEIAENEQKNVIIVILKITREFLHILKTLIHIYILLFKIANKTQSI